MDNDPVLSQLFGVSSDRWGVPGEVALARLQVSSFVSTRNRYLYVMTPKAGCTTIKHMICEIESITIRSEVVPRRNRESKRAMLIHDQDALPIPHLTTLPQDQAAQLLSPDSGYLAFAFVRNPYSRLFSAWNNKLRFVEPSYAPVAAAIRDALGLGGGAAPISFADFVSYVCRHEDPRVCDHHWALQTALLFPDAIPYSFICPIEEFGYGWGLWRSHLEQVKGEPVEVLATPKNVSLPEDWRASLDERLASQIYEYYAEDFIKFGYDRESWKPHGDDDVRQIDESERFFAREIVERNRMIDLLYDKIDDYAEIICYYHAQLQERNQRLDQAYSKVAEYSAMVRKAQGESSQPSQRP